MKTVADKFEKYAYLDWRYDQPKGISLLGYQVNSFANTKFVIDQIKRDGFNGVVFNVNVPIDAATGELTLFDKRQGIDNPNKNLPKDTWKVVQYAKKLKLDVTLNFNIVDYTNDAPLTENNVKASFSKEKLFDSIKTYETQIAGLAQKNKVDMITVGDTFYATEYKDNWKIVVDSVRSKFKGKLSYLSQHYIDTPVFEMVDVISVGQGNASPEIKPILNNIEKLKQKYNKEVQWAPVFIPATDSKVDTWNMLMNNENILDIPVRKDFQADKIREVLKAAIGENNTSLSGIAFAEYSPWRTLNWMNNPINDSDKQWNHQLKLSNELYNNKDASITLTNWLNYSTDDVIGTRRNDTLKAFAGNKNINGLEGRDTLVISNSIKNCKITKDIVNGGFDVYNGNNGVEGIYDMYNVEYVKFNDATVSLVGNYDLSKFGWF